MLKGKSRKYFLFFTGILFYILISKLLAAVLFWTIFITFIFSRLILNNAASSKKYLAAGIIFNLLPLIFYKYLNFLSGISAEIIKIPGWNYGNQAAALLAPIGISFYVFKSISFLVETGRGNLSERGFVNTALYISYFPALIAGPIDKPQNLINQFGKKVTFEYDRVTDSLKYILWGYFNKVVIADRLSPVTDRVFSDPGSFNGIYMAIGILLFTIQIYTDFSGYSYLAYGFSKFIGIDVINNFRRPYFSSSIAEFWKRWHISLSQWLQDYIFLPLSYSIAGFFIKRKIKIKIDYASYIPATMITMLICGLWHGANFTFILWGGYFGLLLSLSVLTRKARRKFKSKLHIGNKNAFLNLYKVGLTFVLAGISWIFFKSGSLSEIIQVFGNIFTSGGAASGSYNAGFVKNILLVYGLSHKEFYLIIIFICGLILVEAAQEKFSLFERIKKQNSFVRWSLYYALLIAVIFFGAYNSQQGFIYQQF